MPLTRRVDQTNIIISIDVSPGTPGGAVVNIINTTISLEKNISKKTKDPFSSGRMSYLEAIAPSGKVDQEEAISFLTRYAPMAPQESLPTAAISVLADGEEQDSIGRKKSAETMKEKIDVSFFNVQRRSISETLEIMSAGQLLMLVVNFFDFHDIGDKKVSCYPLVFAFETEFGCRSFSMSLQGIRTIKSHLEDPVFPNRFKGKATIQATNMRHVYFSGDVCLLYGNIEDYVITKPYGASAGSYESVKGKSSSMVLISSHSLKGRGLNLLSCIQKSEGRIRFSIPSMQLNASQLALSRTTNKSTKLKESSQGGIMGAISALSDVAKLVPSMLSRSRVSNVEDLITVNAKYLKSVISTVPRKCGHFVKMPEEFISIFSDLKTKENCRVSVIISPTIGEGHTARFSLVKDRIAGNDDTIGIALTMYVSGLHNKIILFPSIAHEIVVMQLTQEERKMGFMGRAGPTSIIDTRKSATYQHPLSNMATFMIIEGGHCSFASGIWTSSSVSVKENYLTLAGHSSESFEGTVPLSTEEGQNRMRSFEGVYSVNGPSEVSNEFQKKFTK